MRPTLIILLSFIGLNCFGQNWQLFKTDSLRVYINQTESPEYLRGLDLRNHKTVDGITQIDLSEYGRLGPLKPFEKQNTLFARNIIPNSNFGNHLLITPDSTTLVFRPSELGHGEDTLHFLSNLVVGKQWVVMFNSRWSINARVKSIYSFAGNDSIADIELSLRKVGTNITSNRTLKITKNLGLVEAFSFYDWFDTTTDNSMVQPFELLPYKEQVEVDFYKMTKPTTWQVLVQERRHGYYYRTRRLDQNYFEQYTYLKDSSNLNMFSVNRYSSSYHRYIFDKLVGREQIRSQTKIANPIPGKIGEDFEIYKTKFVCGRQLIIRDSSGYNLRYDSLNRKFVILHLRESKTYITQYIQNFGLFDRYYHDHYKGEVLRNIFIDFGDGCSLGEESWRLTNVVEKAAERPVIFPNPAKDYVQIKSLIDVNRVSAISLAGQIHELTMNNDRANIEDLRPGIYVIQIQTESGTIHKKLLVE